MWEMGAAIGGGALATLVVAVLWQVARAKLAKTEGERDAARTQAELYRERLLQSEANASDAIRRREEVINGLHQEIRDLQEDAAQCSEPGVVVARLKRLLSAPPAAPGAVSGVSSTPPAEVARHTGG